MSAPRGHRPPRLLEAILAHLLPEELHDEVLGDLREAHQLHARRRGRTWAAAWYAGQVVAVPAWLATTALRSAWPAPGEMRHTVRGLARTPGFTLLAVLSLTLGIGATTAIVGALHGILYLELPVERPEELRMVYHTWPERWQGFNHGSSSTTDPETGQTVASNVSYPAYGALVREAGQGAELAGFSFVRELAVVDGDRPAIAASGLLVSGDFFATLRLGVALGRPLTPSDDAPGAPPVAALSYAYWQRAFGASPGVVGRTVLLNGESFEIVGVAQPDWAGLSPGGFFGPSEIMVPMSRAERFLTVDLDPDESLTGSGLRHWVRVIARLDGETAEGPLRAALTATLAGRLVEDAVITPESAADVEVRFLEGRRGLDSLRSQAQGPLRVLGVVVVLVLLIACVNLATLLLARGTARAHELALRRAIGAGRWELVRPLLYESAIIGGLGALGGTALAVRGGPSITSALTGGAGSAAATFQVDALLVGSAAAAGLFSALLAGWLPAWRMMHVDPASYLASRGEGGSGGGMLAGRGLIVAQMAVSVPLVVGAGLFLRTLGNLTEVELGFDAADVVAFRLDASLATTDSAEEAGIYEAVLEELRALPGVESAAAVENVLVSGWMSNSAVTVDGERQMMSMNAVSPGFLETMRIALVSGRDLTESDGSGSTPVALVNETAEERLFGGRAVGRSFTYRDREIRIVGVVADTKYSNLRGETDPTFYDPVVQREGGLYATHFVIRSTTSPARLETSVRDAVAGVTPGAPVVAFRAQTEEIRRAMARERLFARLLSTFGLFALVLACVGLHGITSFAVARRTAEIGVRLALGAEPRGILRLVLGQVLRLAALGLVLGLPAACLVSPVVGSMLYGLGPTDPVTLGTAGAVLLLVALLAGGAPAWRAARVDPMVALSPGSGG